MDHIDQLSYYAILLQTRQRARRRDTVIAGGILLVALLAVLALALLRDGEGRSLHLIFGITLAIGLGYLHAWVRLQIVRGNLELIEYIQRELNADS